jgi:hypothetical protein
MLHAPSKRAGSEIKFTTTVAIWRDINTYMDGRIGVSVNYHVLTSGPSEPARGFE